MEWQTRWREHKWRLPLAAVGMVAGMISLSIGNWPFVIINWALAIINIALLVWTPRWLLDPEDGREGEADSPSVEEMIAAERRAEQTLRTVLTDREWHDCKERGYVDVLSGSCVGRFYRVPFWQSQVKVFEGGRLTMYLCVQPRDLLPPSDVVLMHKLWIEADELGYLATANRWYATPRAGQAMMRSR